MFHLYADKTQLTVCRREPVTSGSVNVYPVRFEFSEDWSGLARTAIFRAGTESRAVLLGGDSETSIPWEVLQRPGEYLFVGVYGTQGGHTVLPTVWASCGVILEGTSLGAAAQPPTPDLWEQELAKKQSKLCGKPAQLVGFNDQGNAVAVDAGAAMQGPPGPKGDTGPQGPQGPKGDAGDQGPAGKDATINGKNAVTLAAGDNVSITTGEDGTVTISSSGGGSGDIYSTEERVVGRWIDGKPLYLIVYCGPCTFKENVEMTYVLEAGFANTRKLINAFGNIDMPYSDTNQYVYSVPISAAQNHYAIVLTNPARDLILSTLWDSPGNGTYQLAIYYTKTADQATIELPAALTAAPPQAIFTAAPQSAAAVTLDAGIKIEEV